MNDAPSNAADAADAERRRKRNRGLLLLIVAAFFGSMLVAGALRFAGWRPSGMKNNGELLQPPVDLRERAPRLASGATYAWNPGERQWRVLVVPPAACGEACAGVARDLDVVWRMMGRNADHVDVLWLCADDGCAAPSPLREDRSLRVLAPDEALRGALPGALSSATAGVPIYVIDPNGFVILRYAPGADLGGLREDLVKLLKLI